MESGYEWEERNSTDLRRSAAHRFFVHVFFDRNLGQRAAVITFVTANAPLLDPLILHVRLPALGTDKHALFVEHSSFFLHHLLPWFPEWFYENRTRSLPIARCTKAGLFAEDRRARLDGSSSCG